MEKESCQARGKNEGVMDSSSDNIISELACVYWIKPLRLTYVELWWL